MTGSVHRSVFVQSDRVQLFVFLVFGTRHMPAEFCMHIAFGCVLLSMKYCCSVTLTACSLDSVYTCACAYSFKINSSAAYTLGLWVE